MRKPLLFIAAAILTASRLTAGNPVKTGDDRPSDAVTAQSESKSAAPEHLTKATFIAKIWDYPNSPQEWKFKGKKPVIIDFYADWCGPCRMAAPILEEVAKEYAGKIDVYKIDTQNEQELASVFGIQSIPAFLYIPTEGKPVMTAGTGRSKEETKKMFIDAINQYLLKVAK